MRAAITRIAPVAALLAGIAGVTVWLVAGVGALTGRQVPLYLATEGVLWLLFAAAVLLLLRAPRRVVPALVLLGTLLVGTAGATGQPTISTDAARYSWDGIVQDAGISPYRYVPADVALAPLRPEWLFPTVTTAPDGTAGCSVRRALAVVQTGAPGTICTIINRPHAPTIYPPVAEALFAATRIAVPRDVAFLPIQLLGLLAVLGTTGLLLATLARTGRDPRLAAVFGWCPFVTMEAVTNAHIDAWSTLLALGATVLVSQGRRLAGGVVLGLAIATKFVPLLVAPPLGRRRPWVIGGAALATVLLVYVPYLLGAGSSVIGFLPGYLAEEGYDGGTRSALLSAVLPVTASTVAAVVLLAALAVVLLLRADPTDPWGAQATMVGTALVLLSPSYAWYSLLLVPFIVMSRRWEWFGVVLVLSVIGFQQHHVAFRLVLLGVALLPVAAGVLRRRRARPAPPNLGVG